MGIKDKLNRLPLNKQAALYISISIFIVTMLLTLLLQLALKQSESAVLESLRLEFPNYVAARQDILNAFTGDNLNRYIAMLPLFAILNLFSIYFIVSFLIGKLFGNYEELIQNTAHEIKTPLFALKTSLDVLKLKKTVSKEDYSNFADTVSIITTRLNRLIESLLIVTKSSREFTASEECNLSDLLIEILKSFNAKISQKQLRFSNSIDPNILCKIQKRYAEALFTNIIDNAIKYSPVKTQINITLKKDQSNKTIIFICKDYGIGIPEHELKRITERFYRASNVIESGEDGSGVGLSAVKKIIDEYGGKLLISSNSNNGLIVKIVVPA